MENASTIDLYNFVKYSTPDECLQILQAEREEQVAAGSENPIDVDAIMKEIMARKERYQKSYKMTVQLKGEFSTNRVWLFEKEILPGESLKVKNHSPDGFLWGYGGSGPAQLALAICIEMFGVDKAMEVYQNFKWKHISGLPRQDFELDITVDIP
ncbi:MAG TPA: DUF6166 domain-containing protein [Cyclobacteriaceae bacterium]|jgi:hypothetical protein|nr:DUF6166 domain-containing protein [Cyclobacteriaceae bacterium]